MPAFTGEAGVVLREAYGNMREPARTRLDFSINSPDGFPHDYPPEWVIGERRSWNEQYIVHALLMYSSGFRVEFACNYAFNTFPQLVGDALRLPNERAFGGASLWITKL